MLYSEYQKQQGPAGGRNTSEATSQREIGPMTTTILAPITVLAAVAAELAQAATEAGDAPNARALNKAAYYLHNGTRPEATVGGYLLASATRGAAVVHRVSADHGCSCEAGQNGKACWHAALVEIVEVAASRRVEKPRIRVSAAQHAAAVGKPAPTRATVVQPRSEAAKAATAALLEAFA
jgi:cell division septation protein DedD